MMAQVKGDAKRAQGCTLSKCAATTIKHSIHVRAARFDELRFSMLTS